MRWPETGGDASKIIFLRVLSGHLSISRFDRLSRFLNHNYEIDFSGNSWSIYIYYSRPATCDPQSVTCDLRPADNRPAGNKRRETLWSVTICLFRYDIYSYKALLNILTSDKFDSFSNNFYQLHNFHNLLMSSLGKNDVTYKSIERVVVG